MVGILRNMLGTLVHQAERIHLSPLQASSGMKKKFHKDNICAKVGSIVDSQKPVRRSLETSNLLCGFTAPDQFSTD